jgi:hypothetical protein
MPALQAGSSFGRRRLAEGDALKTPVGVFYLRSALFIAGPLAGIQNPVSPLISV